MCVCLYGFLLQVKSYNEHKKLAKSGQKEAWTPNWEPVIVFMNSNGISNVWKKNVPYSIHTTQGRSALQISNWGMREKHLGFDPQLGHWIHGMWQGDFDLTEEMELESMSLIMHCYFFVYLFNLKK